MPFKSQLIILRVASSFTSNKIKYANKCLHNFRNLIQKSIKTLVKGENKSLDLVYGVNEYYKFLRIASNSSQKILIYLPI